MCFLGTTETKKKIFLLCTSVACHVCMYSRLRLKLIECRLLQSEKNIDP